MEGVLVPTVKNTKNSSTLFFFLVKEPELCSMENIFHEMGKVKQILIRGF